MDTKGKIAVRVRAFARARELLGGDFSVTLAGNATLADLWRELRARSPELDAMGSSARLARNGEICANLAAPLHEGDEVSVLPPVGGG